jgi:hypothetical protein
MPYLAKRGFVKTSRWLFRERVPSDWMPKVLANLAAGPRRSGAQSGDLDAQLICERYDQPNLH